MRDNTTHKMISKMLSAISVVLSLFTAVQGKISIVE